MRKDGSLLDCEVHGVPMSYGGKPHVLYIGRDITARKGVEEALRGERGAVPRHLQRQRRRAGAARRRVPHRRRQPGLRGDERQAPRRGGRPDRADGERAATSTTERAGLHARALAGEPVHFETDGRRKDGTRFVLEVRGVPIELRRPAARALHRPRHHRGQARRARAARERGAVPRHLQRHRRRAGAARRRVPHRRRQPRLRGDERPHARGGASAWRT